MPGPFDPDSDAQRGGPTQAPERGPSWPQDNSDPQETYPLTRSGGNPTAELNMTGEAWRRMIRRYYGKR